jgi:hypothetical protein
MRSFSLICRGQDSVRDVLQLRQGEVLMRDFKVAIRRTLPLFDDNNTATRSGGFGAEDRIHDARSTLESIVANLPDDLWITGDGPYT